MIVNHNATPVSDPRGDARIIVGRDGTIRAPDGSPVQVSVEDVSVSGCMLHSPVTIPAGYVLNVGLPGLGRREGRIVWQEDGRHGVEFLFPLTAEELEDVRSTDNLILAPFPQRLDTLLTPDEPIAASRTVSRRAMGFVAGMSVILWAGIGYGIVMLAG